MEFECWEVSRAEQRRRRLTRDWMDEQEYGEVSALRGGTAASTCEGGSSEFWTRDGLAAGGRSLLGVSCGKESPWGTPLPGLQPTFYSAPIRV